VRPGRLLQSGLLALVAATVLAACQPTRPAMPATAYRCDDGRQVQADYQGTDRAELTVDGVIHRLVLARSASGARYIGEGWQWWTKGPQAWLAPLHAGESIASAPGVACRQVSGS
jgi:membrane-bound inhibitor of C-type lysozyme